MNYIKNFGRVFQSLTLASSLVLAQAYAQQVQSCVKISASHGGSETMDPSSSRKIYATLPCGSKKLQGIIESSKDVLSKKNIAIYPIDPRGNLIIALDSNDRKMGWVAYKVGDIVNLHKFDIGEGDSEIGLIINKAHQELDKISPRASVGYTESTTTPPQVKKKKKRKKSS